MIEERVPLRSNDEETPKYLKPEEIDFQPIILDVNFLMAPFQFKINMDVELGKVVPECVPVVPSSVLRELESLLRKGNDWKVKAAIELASRYTVVDIRGKGDAPIFNLAVGRRWPVATSDRGLRNKLHKRGIPVVLVRERGHLELTEP